jgi:preprotein translocase subunit SecE
VETLKQSVKRLKTFILESYEEFKKVSWPSREQTIRLTAYVLGVSLGVALFVWLVDLLLKEVLTTILTQP